MVPAEPATEGEDVRRRGRGMGEEVEAKVGARGDEPNKSAGA